MVENGTFKSETFLALTPSCFAMARPSEYSKPDGFFSVLPDAWPFQNDGAGRPKPMTTLPGCFSGGPPFVVVVFFLPPPQAASATTSAATPSSGRRRFTDCPPMCRNLREGRLYSAALE